ncbi:MAG: M14 family metallocarboxypeptidase [Verrucomicrobiales bacterium]|nr:M14 family metallocarboxypeptidase [Verrucomicrobiales bacterium]
MAPLLPPAPLGLNRNGYHGEGVDVAQLLEATRRAATAGGWEVTTFGRSGAFELLALRRPSCVPPASAAPRRVYLSAGIHGDEPAGPLAVLALLRGNRWPANVEFHVCPCLNPAGMAAGQREGPAGKDLNRDYRHRRQPETRAHVGWLQGLPNFDLALCLHEDWEATGFYLYELNPAAHPSRAEAVIEAVARVCPIDPAAQIDGRPAQGGIIRPAFDPDKRPDWPEAFYLAQRKSDHGLTLEAPSDYPLGTRIEALTTAVGAILQSGSPAGNPASAPR